MSSLHVGVEKHELISYSIIPVHTAPHVDRYCNLTRPFLGALEDKGLGDLPLQALPYTDVHFPSKEVSMNVVQRSVFQSRWKWTQSQSTFVIVIAGGSQDFFAQIVEHWLSGRIFELSSIQTAFVCFESGFHSQLECFCLQSFSVLGQVQDSFEAHSQEQTILGFPEKDGLVSPGHKALHGHTQ